MRIVAAWIITVLATAVLAAVLFCIVELRLARRSRIRAIIWHPAPIGAGFLLHLLLAGPVEGLIRWWSM